MEVAHRAGAPEGSTAFEALGGELRLRMIIDDFVERVFSDAMIGFMFRTVSKDRLREMEYQLAAELLGGGIVYRGRPLDKAHEKHRIMGGQFARRTQILRDTLADHEVPPEVRGRWLEHTESLRHLITADSDGECR